MLRPSLPTSESSTQEPRGQHEVSTSLNNQAILTTLQTASAALNNTSASSSVYQEAESFMSSLQQEASPETPYSRFTQHHNFHQYVKELKATLHEHDGGLVSVAPRDVMQSQANDESGKDPLAEMIAALILK